jgi:hypothetical protein
MEINITKFFNEAAPMDYSASAAEIGQDAAADTWRAACDDAPDYNMLDTDEKRDAFRAFVRDSGGWSAVEIQTWSDMKLNALFMQCIAGDMREARLHANMTGHEWEAYTKRVRNGDVWGNIFRADDGEIYFSLY